MIFSKITGNASDKPWLVMVHGFTQSHIIFDLQCKEFCKDFNILLVDLRGHGESGDMDGPYGIEEYTDDLEQIIEYYRIKAFYFWGTHTGTAIGMVYALRYPGRVQALVMEGAVLPGFDMPRVTELINRARRLSSEKSVEAAKKDWFDHADWFGYMRMHPEECRAAEHGRIISRFGGKPWITSLRPKDVMNVNSRLNEFHMPVLLYNGEADLDDFFKSSAHIHEQIKHSQRKVISKAGGFPCWENPVAVYRLVRSFLNENMAKQSQGNGTNSHT